MGGISGGVSSWGEFVISHSSRGQVMVGISEESRRLKEFMSTDPAMVTDGMLTQLVKTMASLSSLSTQLRRFFADTEVRSDGRAQRSLLVVYASGTLHCHIEADYLNSGPFCIILVKAARKRHVDMFRWWIAYASGVILPR